MSDRIPVVITSVLKPVNDTRMFEKFGLSISQTNKYEVNIIGFDTKNIKKIRNVNFYPIFRFRRNALQRLSAPYHLFYYLLKVRPSIIIFNTPEILHVIILYKLLTGCRVIYDLQENYYRNIVYNRNYPAFLKWLLGSFIRFLELSGQPFIDRTIFAEKGYFLEMPYWKSKATLIRNTYKHLYDFKRAPHQHLDKRNLIHIIYTGTISENYGVFRAVEFIEQLHRFLPQVNLIIAGHCANGKVLKKLLRRISNRDYIELMGGDQLVPHEEIIQLIQYADFGIICYEINPSTENCFPTKIYEYMANRLPILIQHYKPWSEFCLRHDGGIAVDFDNIDFKQLIQEMKNKDFYGHGLPGDIYWEEDEKKLMDLLDDIQR